MQGERKEAQNQHNTRALTYSIYTILYGIITLLKVHWYNNISMLVITFYIKIYRVLG